MAFSSTILSFSHPAALLPDSLRVGRVVERAVINGGTGLALVLGHADLDRSGATGVLAITGGNADMIVAPVAVALALGAHLGSAAADALPS